MRIKGPAKLLVVVASMAILCVAGFGAFWSYSSPERSCGSCHEIRSTHDIWAQSSHRNAPCAECHGTTLSNGLHSLQENARRVVSHFADREPGDIRLSEIQVTEMVERCRKCHEREYAGWLSSGHSASYADIFLNDAHNESEQPQDDCLRCHGMFFEGTIRDIVTPLSTQGPWRLVKEELAGRPVIPCLACHEIHLQGSPAASPDHAQPKEISYKRAFKIQKPSFYDRRERIHFEIGLLPAPDIRLGERSIEVAPDGRQRLCYQCHAPDAWHQAGSEDDLTPRGVHEGLSCLACHTTHSMEARRSCRECHPSLSNCGLDVETMDTSYASGTSPHNIHFVECTDCHVTGVPAKK